jgi:hypothetical protein
MSTDQIGVNKPPAFYIGDVAEHLRQIADYLNAAGDRANATSPKDGSEFLQMVTFDHLEHAMTASENNVDLDDYSVVRLDSDGAYDITGLVAGDGRRLLIINVSAFTITLEDQDVLSTDVNRLRLGAPHLLLAEASVELWYDSVTNRWRRIAG